MKLTYVYFVSYSTNKGFGCREVEMKYRIKSITDILIIHDSLKASLSNIEDVAVLNYKFLRYRLV